MKAPQHESRTMACVSSALTRHDSLPKAIIDIVGSSILILVLSPLLMIIAGLVLVTSGRPIIYRRRVVGTDGEFDAYKFRTMRPDADRILEQDAGLRLAFHSNFKLQRDPRTTRIGTVLRKFSLDELPQLFNVLHGQMSLVGPRMITAEELTKYGEYKELLLTVKPGLTGYWQVHGRQQVSYSERVRMDVEYIQTWSLRTDIQLLLMTPWQVLRGKGAY